MRGRWRPRGLFSVAAMGKCNWCRTTLEPGDRHQKGPRACVACLATINQFHCHCEQRWPRVVPPRLLVPADPNADAPHSIGPRLAGAFGADDEYIYIALFCSPFHLFWLLRFPQTHKKQNARQMEAGATITCLNEFQVVWRNTRRTVVTTTAAGAAMMPILSLEWTMVGDLKI